MASSYSEKRFYQQFEKCINRLRVSRKIEEIYKEIENMKLNQNTDTVFEYFSNLEEFTDSLPCKIESKSKSEDDSISFRKEGNHYYKHKVYDEALRFYNKSIIYAQPPSLQLIQSDNADCEIKQYHRKSRKYKLYDSLVLGYVKRSEVLYGLKQYQKCLSDIDRSLELNVPKNLLSKLIFRKAKCLKELQKLKQAEEVLQNYANYLKNTGNFNEKMKRKIYIAIKNYQLKSTLNSDTETITEINSANDEIAQSKVKDPNEVPVMTMDEMILAQRNPESPQLVEVNPSNPSFSNGITISYSEDKGRHITSTRDITPGELIAVDKAYSTSIHLNDSEVVHTFCCVCLVRTPTPLPCPHCTMVVFCSDSCKESGLSEFHNIECSFLSTIKELGVPQLCEILRIMTKTTFSNIKKRYQELKIEKGIEASNLLGFNEASVYDSSNYKAVFHLVDNFPNRSVLDILKVCSEAYILTDLLRQCGNFFTDENGESLSPSKDDLILTGSACFTHLLSASCNSFDISEYQVNIDDIDDYSLTNIGRGSFPSLALINHSCDPSAMVLSYGSTNICRAVKFIPKGSEVTISYGKLYYKHDIADRRNYLLNHYFFTCLCEACTADWNLPEETEEIQLPKMKNYLDSICDDLTKETLEYKLKFIVDKFEASIMKIQLEGDDPEKYLDVFIDLLIFFEQYVELPNILYFQAEKYLLFCKGVKLCPCKYYQNTP